MKKPRVITKCVANTYSAPNERIIEFAGPDPDQGGLIAFRILDGGMMFVTVYRQGAKVVVRVGEPEPATV